MLKEGEMGVVEDLDHPEITGIRHGVFPGDRHPGYELPGAIQPDPGGGVGMGAGIDKQAGNEKEKSGDGVEFHTLKSMNIQFWANIQKRPCQE